MCWYKSTIDINGHTYKQHYFSNMFKKNKNKMNKYMEDIKWEDIKWEDIKWEDTVEFTFPIQEGVVIKVYDGDTITIAAKLPYIESPLYRFPVRLNGLDTPELKGNTDDEKTAAKQARDALSQLVLHKKITLKNVQNEKYGRILADVYLDNLCINDWLIKERFAVKYDGGAKQIPASWLKYKIVGEY
jgi:endonuclease YncB( thermonuclease family)